MRIVLFIVSALTTLALIVLLNTSLTIGGNKTPRFGNFFSPNNGFWQNAEPTNTQFNENIPSNALKGKVEVFFDDRLVPHVYAEQENDVYFVQGYLHAKFRLWQMEFQTHVAAGRMSEVMGRGNNFLERDRFFRRLGMVFGAEKSLKELEANPITKSELDAYTTGVNAYINSLKPAAFPLEYKLLNYAPEQWTNLKTTLFFKYMSYQLAGWDADFEMTNAQSIFLPADIEKLYPIIQDSLEPIIPRGTVFNHKGPTPKKPANIDSIYYHSQKDSGEAHTQQPDKSNGSNNWAVAGSKTKSGAPILCNDPHVPLTLPSLWYEMQISTPGFNSYGVTLPGTPSIIVGFNESCAWGLTNALRDVKDYYEIKFRDSTMQEYYFNGKWLKPSFRNEIIKVKGEPDVSEKIAITLLGPVMYDHKFSNILKNGKYYAVRWVADDASNDLLTFNRLNHAKDYADFLGALSSYHYPGQNFVFASKAGDIAIRQQGKFPAKWQRQGDFLMPGIDSSYAWQGFIPFDENPTLYNPERGFVSSANQLAADKNYPYYLAGRPLIYRGIIINRWLNRLSDITIKDMQQMQTDNYDVFAEMAKPFLLKHLDVSRLTSEEMSYLNKLKDWNLRTDYDEEGGTIFDLWWRQVYKLVFMDELAQSGLPVRAPDNSTLLEALIKDSTFKFVDDINTPSAESLREIVSLAFKNAAEDVKTLIQRGTLAWGRYKNTEIKHPLNLGALSSLQVPIGGNQNSINAVTKNVGPSWRMIVQLTKDIEAYGAFAGGQSGNPGSKYYSNSINEWTKGNYHQLLFLKLSEAENNPKIKWHMTFSKS